MFAVHFDDMRRRLLAKPVLEFPYEVKRLATCMVHTPLWDEWIEKYMAEGSKVAVTVEDDRHTYTFWELVDRKEEVSK